MPEIILASVSPRRQELLHLIFADFSVIPSDFDESLVVADGNPVEHASLLAQSKSQDVASKHPDALVIGADTIVVLQDEIFGKPQDEYDAKRMLQALSGQTHQVYTAVAVCYNDEMHAIIESTDVTFRDLNARLIDRYIHSGEPMDKAGAYAIQGLGAILVEKISGCFFNVVGLPVFRLNLLVEDLGLETICR